MECPGGGLNGFAIDLGQSDAPRLIMSYSFNCEKEQSGNRCMYKERQHNLFSQIDKLRKLGQFQYC